MQIINGVEFNKEESVSGAKIGWWIEESIGLVVWYGKDGISQHFGKRFSTERQRTNQLKKLFECGAIKND